MCTNLKKVEMNSRTIAVVLMTDGPSEVGDVVLEANRAKNGANPVTIVAVGVGDQVNRTELRAVASG